jgi:hypothetical protein
MIPDDEVKYLILKDKREIHLNVTGKGCIATISIISNGKTTFSFQDIKDYGGGSIFLSPSNLYLLLAYYSGQGEEYFILFKITEKLEIVYQSCCLYGEASSYCFSEDEKLLIQGLPNCCTFYDCNIEEFLEKDKDGNMFLDFGYINIFDIEKKAISEYKIGVYFSDDWHGRALEKYNPFMSPELINHNTLKILMPWGYETLNFPLRDDTIIFRR